MNCPGKRNLLHQPGRIKFFPLIPQINPEFFSAKISEICGRFNFKPMKVITLTFFLIFISLFCYSQTNSVVKQDSTIFISRPFSLYSPKSLNSSSAIPSTNCILKNNSVLFDLNHFSMNANNYYKDSYYNSDLKEMVVFNRNHYYYLNDPIKPYGNCEFAVFAGTINYLILMLNN